MIEAEMLRPQRHDPPPGWSAEVFSRLTDAIAAALLANLRRADGEERVEAREAAGQ